jgi:hypothetical protein
MNGVGLMEQGRTTSSGVPLLVTLSVPDGAYNNTQLAEELTFQANNTPPLNLISYPAFRDAFMNTRDISLLFNEPGNAFSSKCTSQRYGTHTKEHIMNTYYTQQHIDGFFEITEQIAFVAYYFPILKELIATHKAEPFLQFADMTFSEVSNAVMGSFRGLDDPLYFSLCDANQPVLDAYRKYLTFELRNINKYDISYRTNRFSIIHDTLHPSITRDLTKSHQSFLNQELSVRKLNANSFKTLKTNSIGYTSILRHLESNLSSVLGTYHFATGYRYSGGMDHMTDECAFHAITDLHEDPDFTTMFSYTSTIGRIYGNYIGQRMAFTNFLDYHSTLSSYYQIVQSTNSVIQSVQQQTQQDFHSYVSSKYAGILPDSMIANQSYTAQQGLPVSFVGNQYTYFPGILPSQILPTGSMDMLDEEDCTTICCNEITKLVYAWYSCIPVETNVQTIFYRLGLQRFPSGSFSIVSTFTEVVSTSFQNYLISINEEQGFNNMDISMNENYTISNETTGQVKYICAKVLMANVDNSNISQALIQNPIVFDQPLGKLDRLSFKIYFDDAAVTPAWLYVPSYLDVNEWNATFQIEEEIGYASVDAGWGETPTIPIPCNPDAMQYLFLREPNSAVVDLNTTINNDAGFSIDASSGGTALSLNTASKAAAAQKLSAAAQQQSAAAQQQAAATLAAQQAAAKQQADAASQFAIQQQNTVAAALAKQQADATLALQQARQQATQQQADALAAEQKQAAQQQAAILAAAQKQAAQQQEAILAAAQKQAAADLAAQKKAAADALAAVQKQADAEAARQQAALDRQQAEIDALKKGNTPTKDPATIQGPSGQPFQQKGGVGGGQGSRDIQQ